MKLALGTAQFGLSYGIANQNGQVSSEEISKILTLGRESGIEILDTAAVYGESEISLGEVGTEGFNVVTKLPPLPNGLGDVANWVSKQVRTSLNQLNLDSVYGVLVHRTENLSGASGKIIFDTLQRFKSDGVIKKVGVSVYHPRELDAVAEAYNINLVQAPFNVFDSRLATSGWLNRLKEKGTEVHARSIFLQGLLLMSHESIPKKFKPWFDLFNRWYEWLEANNVDAVEACLAYVTSQTLIDQIVVGVESRAQLQQLVNALEKVPSVQMPDLSCNDERLINPSNWNQL